MRQLTENEEHFLKSADVKGFIPLKSINELQTSIVSGKRKRFDQTIELANIIGKSVVWFDSEEAKVKFVSAGILWNKETFGEKVFGYTKSHFYKLIKVSALSSGVIALFNADCDKKEQTDTDERTLANLLLFSRKLIEKEINDEIANEESEEGEESEAVESKAKDVWILNLSYKNKETGNVSIRISDTGEVKSSNSKFDIQQAIAFLQNQLVNFKEKEVKVKEVKEPKVKGTARRPEADGSFPIHYNSAKEQASKKKAA